MLNKSFQIFPLTGEHPFFALLVHGRNQAQIAEGYTTYWRCQRTDPFLGKMGFG
jgi:hypothetical protein